ncbi:MAG: hypothetical protein OWU84_01435 [Firmicutes bacterium]|nr:hypothetical protein [Bacillota bacterium]
MGRSEYLAWIQGWIDNEDHPFRLVTLHGPAGIGKSTLLDAIRQIAELAGAAVWSTNAAYLSTPMAWIDYMGFLWRQHPPGAIPHGTLPGPDRMDILQALSTVLSARPSFVLIDNADLLGMTGEWLRTQFLPPLRQAPVVVILASRYPLTEWLASPFWQADCLTWPLPAFSYEHTLDYLKARQIDADEWGAELFRQTHGHPLSLALAVDRVGHDPASVSGLSQTVTAQVLREVIREDWIPHLEALALVQEADQAILEAITGRELGSLDYHQLLSLSFVQPDPNGLRMHDTIRQLLIDDLRQRDPLRFYELRRRALGVLGEWRSGDDAAMRLRTGAILLELYREDLPLGDWLTFSAVSSWSLHSRVTASDSAALHALLPEIPRTHLLSPHTQHAMLDALIDVQPAGVRVIRDPREAPLGFWAGIWLSERTMPLLDRFMPMLTDALGEEGQRYRYAPEALADTCVTLFFCCRDAHPLYSPEQVRGLVLYDALIVLGGSVRVLSTSEHPPFRTVMQSIGLRPRRFATPRGDIVELLVGDKRGRGFLAFLWWLDRLSGPPQWFSAGFHWRSEDAEALLRALHQRNSFRDYLAQRQFLGDWSLVRHRLLEILTRHPAPPPLTAIEQELLRNTFLDPNAVSSAVADRMHVSRSTYYRYRKTAVDKVADLLNHPDDPAPSPRPRIPAQE